MSGIVGILYLDDRKVDRQKLERMVDSIAHRGPDGATIWSEGSIGFGHRMLWTTPESLLETFPLVNTTGDVVLTSDARIDNRDELIRNLDLTDRPAEKITDSQLILSAYEKWGEDCPQYLLGDFAFAIWDERQQRIFCARDHFGVKPLYYHYQSGKAFYFASEIKALLCLPGIPRRVNEVRIADYLYPMLEDKSITAYEGIFRLPPAQTMTVSVRGQIDRQTYWTLEFKKELRLGSDEEYAAAFREVFTEAVRCRLRSAFPVGSHLSGGLDSSSITCVARNLLRSQGAKLHSFSNVFDTVTECDEREFIEPIVAQGGLTPHYLHPDRTGPLSQWEDIFPADEEPCLIGANGYLVWGLNRAAQDAGVRVVLDGFDGDTTVSHGMGYFAELARQGQWGTFAAEANALCQHFDNSPSAILHYYGLTYLEELAKQWKWLEFAKAVRSLGRHFKISSYKKLLLRYGLKPIIPSVLLKVWQFLHGRNSASNNIPTLVNPNFSRRIGIESRAVALDAPQHPIKSDREEQWRTLTSGGLTLVLEQGDRGAAACSIESRHPFMDKRLIEFCMALPASQKLKQGWTRAILRRAMEGILPETVQWRGGKTDMNPNCLYGLLNYNQKLLDEVVFAQTESIAPYIDLNTLRQSYKRLVLDGKVTNEDFSRVWQAIGLALWLRQT
jgi:asparagine synthase (glutamine-hydrolysing)